MSAAIMQNAPVIEQYVTGDDLANAINIDSAYKGLKFKVIAFPISDSQSEKYEDLAAVPFSSESEATNWGYEFAKDWF
ncbi:hypothetical protein FACS1894125_0210 [Actinomycetota bacterium]|nr:hypothetical protein FACS1894125_0210 [Actinomycetota bacterium]